ncbi:MAG TPA: hypothetical protein VHP11_12500, partial [Tepidisphaeraceae bacterium]|nr:hypothetical protein [Tepidisphaeraceae bacterium]
ETPDEDTTIAARFQAEQAKVAQESTKVETEFDRLEAALRASLEQRLEEQPLAELIKGYEKIIQSDYLSVPMRRISEIRLLGLRGKYQAQQELLATRKQQQEMTDRINAIRAEREALEQKMSGNVIMYTAVGKLQPSTLQVGTGTLYRMVDPNTSRTVCYVRSSDPKYLDFIDQFVGVRGELTNDAQVALKVVNSTEIETVDPAKVNKGITAQVTPNSFLSNTEEKTQTQETPAKEEKSEK